MKITDALLSGLGRLALGLLHLAVWGLSRPLGDLVALVLLAVLFWRFNLSGYAQERNRARAMRWRARCRCAPGTGSLPWPSWAPSGAAWPPPTAAAGPGPAWPSGRGC